MSNGSTRDLRPPHRPVVRYSIIIKSIAIAEHSHTLGYIRHPFVHVHFRGVCVCVCVSFMLFSRLYHHLLLLLLYGMTSRPFSSFPLQSPVILHSIFPCSLLSSLLLPFPSSSVSSSRFSFHSCDFLNVLASRILRNGSQQRLHKGFKQPALLCTEEY